ncbi:DUF1080 domain-containing protein [Ginsengibacter hankyongi]|uniref:DUF1080 domain-containing protein n=1 Tax=Ginsengibacter hankyongi TaxID=2607284 RepID=A0A5J5IBV8_9BACT|nr:DUF1080 domain-containing protein [Ginsengibacter hankyongi]KAA9035472.1 DUF1080 domain-containing protein [Ginsengibacter hankyongi]
MKFIFLYAFICLGFCTNAQQNKKLFNGKDLNGWTIHGTEKWYVKDGLLICESGPDKQYGYLSTDKNYKNFILTLEFKQDANGNSGVFFRSQIPEGVKISGWQAEVAPPGMHTGGIYESYGRGWLIQPKKKDEKYLKMGMWNTYKIKADGDEVTTWLNGHRMCYIKDEKIGQGEGFIALQIHEGGGIKVSWKNIRIEELKKK